MIGIQYSIPDILREVCSDSLRVAQGDEAKADEITRLFGRAVSGDVAAGADLGYCYLTGLGLPVNVHKGQALLQAAVAHEEGPIPPRLYAKTLFGLCYIRGIGIAQDGARGIAWLRDAAADNDLEAQFQLAKCYLRGVGVKIDEREGFRLLRQAADQGYPKALKPLGDCYLFGIGIERDGMKAVELFRRAAEQDYVPAMVSLGFCYQHGIGVDRDESNAILRFEGAAEQGDELARVRLAFCEEFRREGGYEAVKGNRRLMGVIPTRVRCKTPTTFEIFKEVSLFCMVAGFGIAATPKEAVLLYRIAAEKGDADAQHLFADCLERGSGIRRDPILAITMYRKAAEQNHVGALMDLARICSADDRIAKVETMRLLDRAAELTDRGWRCGIKPDALFGIAVALDEGAMGFEADPAKAASWFRRAAELDYSPAWYEFGRCCEEGVGVAQDEAEALKWYKQAAEAGDFDAIRRLIAMYEEGRGTEKECEEMALWMFEESEMTEEEALLIHRRGTMTLEQSREAARRQLEAEGSVIRTMEECREAARLILEKEPERLRGVLEYYGEMPGKAEAGAGAGAGTA